MENKLTGNSGFAFLLTGENISRWGLLNDVLSSYRRNSALAFKRLNFYILRNGLIKRKYNLGAQTQSAQTQSKEHWNWIKRGRGHELWTRDFLSQYWICVFGMGEGNRAEGPGWKEWIGVLNEGISDCSYFIQSFMSMRGMTIFI